MDYKTTYPQVFKSTFRYSGGFFSIRFKPHQVVSTLFKQSTKRFLSTHKKAMPLKIVFEKCEQQKRASL